MILQVKEIANQNVKIAPQRKTMNSKIAPGKKKIISSLAVVVYIYMLLWPLSLKGCQGWSGIKSNKKWGGGGKNNGSVDELYLLR